jgi:hypothetical protein
LRGIVKQSKNQAESLEAFLYSVLVSETMLGLDHRNQIHWSGIEIFFDLCGRLISDGVIPHDFVAAAMRSWNGTPLRPGRIGAQRVDSSE